MRYSIKKSLWVVAAVCAACFVVHPLVNANETRDKTTKAAIDRMKKNVDDKKGDRPSGKLGNRPKGLPDGALNKPPGDFGGRPQGNLNGRPRGDFNGGLPARNGDGRNAAADKVKTIMALMDLDGNQLIT
ncbi:hypothetical protein N9242_05220, partial [Vicingaceae bacterium]|nr:hypothetical protein [Vicingaceae bacterium]